MSSTYALLGVPATGFNSEPFTTSWGMPRIALAVIRLVLSLYIITSISYSYAYFAGHKVTFHLQDVGITPVTFQVGAEGIRQSFSYFTYLSYWSQSFYFFFASMHTFVAARNGVSWLDSWPRYLQAAHSGYYSCITSFPILVSSVYWSSMYIGPFFDHDFDRWSALSIHGLNSAFCLFEIIFTSTRPQPWSHLGILLLIMSLYLPLPYITHETEGIYIYLWLDPKNGIPQLIAHVVAYAMAVVVIFNISRGIIWLRCSILSPPTTDSASTIFSEKSTDSFSRKVRRFSALRALESTDDLEKAFEGSSINIPLVRSDMRTNSIYQMGIASRSSTTTVSIPLRTSEAFGMHIPLPPEPVHSHQPAYPSRSSSFHVRNFSRPTSQATTAPSLRGFWV